MEEATVSTHDELLLKKITRICCDSTIKLENAVCSANVLGLINLYYDELVSHMEDLVDELESPEIKAFVLLELVGFKTRLEETRAVTKAKLDFWKGNA